MLTGDVTRSFDRHPANGHDAVLERLHAIILESNAKGGQLPTERVLCKQLGVSRPTLREHLNALEVIGLLQRNQGRGTFLRPPDGAGLGSALDLAMVAAQVPPEDLMFVRRVLERESASLAAGRIDAPTQVRMKQLCIQMRASLPVRDIAAADHEFHMLLFTSSGNAALAFLGATLSQALHRTMGEMREFISSDKRAKSDMARAHERVLDAAVSGDSQKAWHEMDRHFTLNERIARRIARSRGSSTL